MALSWSILPLLALPVLPVLADMSLDAGGARLALAPARRPPAPTPAPAPPPPPAYTEAQASADLEQVLVGRGREYLEARARLEASPAIAAPLVSTRLTGTPAPTQVEQRRLLALLGVIARPEDIEHFAAALRRDVAAQKKLSQEQGSELRAAEPWREILRAQGTRAAPALTGLVAEKTFSEELRAQLIADLVAVTPPEQLPGLVALVGLGAPTLRAALRQAIARRAQSAPQERALLIAAVDAALAASEPARKAGLVLLRATLGDAADAAFTQVAVGLAEDEGAGFGVRVAAIRVLTARRSDPAAQATLERLATHHLAPERRDQQRSEILGSLALAGVEPARARALVERLQLTRAAAPRTAAAAYAVAELPRGAAWLEESQKHPWPEVRSAALARVEAPCDAALVARLRDALATASARRETDAAVAREAIVALGRCGGPEAHAALVALVGDAEQDLERRAEAARQVLRNGDPRGVDAVAAALRGTDDLAFAMRLVRALQRLEGPPTQAVRDALCAASGRGELASAARRTLDALYPDDDEPCTAPR